MIKTPGRRKRKRVEQKINLAPILDAIFIFIFFLLMSVSFIHNFEIESNVPITSSGPPPKNKKPPLALTLKIAATKITILKGVPSRALKSFSKAADGQYDLEALHQFLIGLKQKYSHEDTIIFEPLVDVTYEDIIVIMDAVRSIRKTDDSIYKKDENGIETKLNLLFSNIIFGNIQS